MERSLEWEGGGRERGREKGREGSRSRRAGGEKNKGY
jgi:hypothetical protein